MKIKQFQPEAVTSRTSRLSDVCTVDDVTGQTKSVNIASLLLKIHNNNRLNEKDQNLLKSLSPKDCVFFLIKNKEFIYPEDFKLFPYEIIESAVNQGGPAIFTQNFQKSNKRSDEQCKIISSLLCCYDDENIVLGLVGKGLPYRNFSEEDSFMNHVNLFRKIERDIQPIILKIKKYLSEKSSRIIVDRNDGSIMAINSIAEDIFMDSAENIIGLTLEQLKTKSASLFAHHKVIMENMKSEYSDLAFISICNESATDRIDFDVNRFTVDQIRSHSNNIILASSYLDSFPKDKTDKNQFIKMILSEAGKINQILTQAHLYLDYQNISMTEQNLINELEHALDTAELTCETEDKTKICNNSSNTNLIAPAGIYKHIFEQILSVHNNNYKNIKNRQITIDQLSDNKIRLTFKSLLTGEFKENDTHQNTIKYLYNLAKKLKITFNHKTNHHKINTTLTIRLDSTNEN